MRDCYRCFNHLFTLLLLVAVGLLIIVLTFVSFLLVFAGFFNLFYHSFDLSPNTSFVLSMSLFLLIVAGGVLTLNNKLERGGVEDV